MSIHARNHKLFIFVLYLVIAGLFMGTIYIIQKRESLTDERSRATSAVSCDFTIDITPPVILSPTGAAFVTTTITPNPTIVAEETPPPMVTSPATTLLPTPTVPDVVCERRVAIAIAIDRSQSMNQLEAGGKTKLDLAKDAARAFVRAIAESDSRNIAVSIVSFGGQGNDGTGRQSQSTNSTLHIGASTDYNAVANAITGMGGIQSGGTCIQCGIRIGNGQLASFVDTKAFILLTDGLSNRVWNGTSTNAKQATISEASDGRGRGIAYHVIGFGDKSRGQIDESTLTAIAGSTGSYSYKPDGQSWMESFFDLLPKFCTPVTP